MWFYYLVFLAAALQLGATDTVHPSCLVNLGQSASARGVLRQTFDNTSYCAFLGVRYAEPPVGHRRFRHSEVLEPEGHRNYTTYGSKCAQIATSKLEGDEDCLFMNIYSPTVDLFTGDDAPSYPVLVFVHGGSYVVGWAERDIDGVDLLVDNGILVVTFNYRIYALGFLKSEQHGIAGNFGLKDQTTLLRWVQRYIRYFGGDPSQVTFAGQSAGAASVTLHMYIEQSKGLFHRMIALSGSMLGSWSFLQDASGCIEKYLNNLSTGVLERHREMEFRNFFPPGSWWKYTIYFASMYIPCMIPVLESEENQQDNFTVRPPHESVLQAPINPVPIIIGHTALEFDGLLVDVHGFRLGENVPKNINDTVRSLVNTTMYKFAEKLIAEGQANSYTEVFQTLSNTVDLHYPALRLVMDLSHTLDPSVPVYYQQFQFDGKFGKGKNFFYTDLVNATKYGAMHSDDLGYIFSPFNLKDAVERPQDFEREWKVHRGTVEMIVNFIKFGNPTPTASNLSNLIWPPVNGKKSPNMFLNIGENFELLPISKNTYVQQWEKVYDCLFYERCQGIIET